MNFRQCVIDCIAAGEVVQSFNRLHGQAIAPHLLSLLSGSGGQGQRLAELADTEQELLACFILFVHRHVWRKMKLAEARVTRVTRMREDSEVRGQDSRPFADNVRSFVRPDTSLGADRSASVGQEST